MITLRALQPYKDDSGNEIVYDGVPVKGRVIVRFSGTNNRLVVAADAKIIELRAQFVGDGGSAEILPTSRPRTGLRFSLRVGHESHIRIGENVGSQGRTLISAVEGADVAIGNDCMLATGIEIRTDDSHPIYSVRSGKRVNTSESISIGDHVWLAKHAVVMGGVEIGSGSVVGFRSIVTGSIPNNCIAVGAPARVVKNDIVWERPMLARRRPGQTGPGPGEKSERYWKLTSGVAGEAAPLILRRATTRSSRLGRFVPAAIRPAARRWVRRARSTAAQLRHTLRRAR